MAEEVVRNAALGLWWPAWDKRAEGNCAYIRERVCSTALAISLARKHGVCVQAGGHAGIWPLHLSRHFGRVHTFEPQQALGEALERNTADRNITVHHSALSDHAGPVKMRQTSNPATWRLDEEGTADAKTIRLDDLKLEACDAIFLDVERHEPKALAGAENTIRRHRPVIQIEEHRLTAQAIHETLARFGYVIHSKVRGDSVYVPA